MGAERQLSELELVRKNEVIGWTKSISMIVEATDGNSTRQYLYRPESGVRVVFDSRVPIPQELYRDVAYHRVAQVLGWDVTAPIDIWTLEEGDKGVIREYYPDAKALEIFNFNETLLSEQRDFLTKVAVLDFICGVLDRNARDILDTAEGLKVVDSGLSFVCDHHENQNSIVRNLLKGKDLPSQIHADLCQLDRCGLVESIGELVPNDAMTELVGRVRILAIGGKVI